MAATFDHAQTPHSYRPYTDRAAMETDFSSFLVNHRRVHNVLLPINQPGAIPMLVIESDPAFRDLLRLHRDDDPHGEGGDLAVDTRVALDTKRGVARVALRFEWESPATYTMTIVLRLPKHLDWLTAALRYGSALCTPAPIHPLNSGLCLPFSNPDLGPHVALAMAALVMYPTKAGKR